MPLPSGPANTRCSVCRFDLIGRSSGATPGRRQERVWRAQRLEAKIHAIATSVGGRDRTPAFEPAKMPANCGLFVRDWETPVRIGVRGGGAAGSNPSPHLNSLITGKLTGNFAESGFLLRFSCPFGERTQWFQHEIPYAREQGICQHPYQGKFSGEQGTREMQTWEVGHSTVAITAITCTSMFSLEVCMREPV